jgi:hypothetical protein
MQTKDITPKEYANFRGCSLQNITKHIRNNKSLPHVITIKQWSRFYTLEVPATLNADTFKKITPNK